MQFLNGFWMVSALPHLEVIKSVQILMFLLGWNTSSQKPSTKYKITATRCKQTPKGEIWNDPRAKKHLAVISINKILSFAVIWAWKCPLFLTFCSYKHTHACDRTFYTRNSTNEILNTSAKKGIQGRGRMNIARIKFSALSIEIWPQKHQYTSAWVTVPLCVSICHSLSVFLPPLSVSLCLSLCVWHCENRWKSFNIL